MAKRVGVTEFKQTCLREMEEVHRSGQALIVTKRGKPLVKVVPVASEPAVDWAGAMRGRGSLADDLVAPPLDLSDWEVLDDRSGRDSDAA